MIKKDKFHIQGFTLVELVLAVLIIATLASAAVVSFSQISSRRLESDRRKIIAELSWAREMAVNKHQDYVIDFDIVNDRYVIYQSSIAAANEIKRRDLDVDIIAVAPLPAQVQFSYPQGSSLDKDITISHQGRTEQIHVFGETGYIKQQ